MRKRCFKKIMIIFSVLIILLGASIQVEAGIGKGGVFISRIVTTFENSNFIYIAPDSFPGCKTQVWGVDYDILYVPTKELLANLMYAKSTDRAIRLLIVSNDVPDKHVPGVGYTKCSIDYADVE